MNKINRSLLYDFAHYIWWKTPDEAVRYPDRLIAQVMNYGTMDDILRLMHECGRDVIIDILRHAEAGWFDKKVWNFWHIFYGLSDFENVPPLPQRELPIICQKMPSSER